MNTPQFSIVIIARNEAKTLPRAIASLEAYMQAGGDVSVVDTGSSDGTADIARSLGCKVQEVGNKYLYTISESFSKKINERFVRGGDQPIVKPEETYFDFASARNVAAAMADCDMVSTMDSDEVMTVLDIDKINEIITTTPNLAQMEYSFIFSHSADGKPLVQFVQSKFYNRNKMEWRGIIHEIVSPITGGDRYRLGENVFLLEHFQNQETNRSGYLRGLAVDCFNNPDNDRNAHYLGRECMYTGRYLSAIEVFETHVAMNRWPAERAQSFIYMGDCYGKLNIPDKQVECYLKAMEIDPTRREAPIKLAGFYKHNNNPHLAAMYSAGALQLPWSDYYANDKRMYQDVPHALLYWALGWMGDIAGAAEHNFKALQYQPFNPEYLRDTQYYQEYPDQGIPGWMLFEELQWLYNTAKSLPENALVAEVGSWKFRSGHALASGLQKIGGKLSCIDTWKGSQDLRDDTNWMAKQEDVYAIFKENSKGCTNVLDYRLSSEEAAPMFLDETFDLVFIDAEHTFEGVKKDLLLWKDKVRKGGILCGHDWKDSWMGVIEAVREVLGEPDEIHGTIWVHYIK